MAKFRFFRSKLVRVGIALLAVCLLLVACLALWIVHLDRTVTREFQGRHWSVPARVFAAPVELYAGAPMGANDIEEQLLRLHYRPSDTLGAPGFYRRHGDAFDLHARRVRFSDELRDAQLVIINAEAIPSWA